mmetsp:Transcript_19677/g.45924  ORF Transcript_19677/g.45924 Transcript_19677/m.45924 type:complete len:207 (+) Transcript_19677:365-985(+)
MKRRRRKRRRFPPPGFRRPRRDPPRPRGPSRRRLFRASGSETSARSRRRSSDRCGSLPSSAAVSCRRGKAPSSGCDATAVFRIDPADVAAAAATNPLRTHPDPRLPASGICFLRPQARGRTPTAKCSGCRREGGPADRSRSERGVDRHPFGMRRGGWDGAGCAGTSSALSPSSDGTRRFRAGNRIAESRWTDGNRVRTVRGGSNSQ